MRIRPNRLTIGATVCLASVLLLTFSTHTYSLPAKKNVTLHVYNKFPSPTGTVFEGNVYKKVGAVFRFEVFTGTGPLLFVKSGWELNIGQGQKIQIEHDAEYFRVKIFYLLHPDYPSGSSERRILWVHMVRDGAKILVRHDERRVYAEVWY